MLDHPRLRRDLTVAAAQNDKLFISRNGRSSLIEGTIAVRLAPLLDGTRDIAALLDGLPGAPMGAVLKTLSHLERSGYTVEGPAQADVAVAGFWDSAGVAPDAAQAAIAEGTVQLRAVGDADTQALRDGLQRAGVRVVEDGDDAALLIVVAHDYLHPDLAELNRELVAAGRQWVLAKLTGAEIWLGPHLRPGGACWACMAQRLEANRQLERYLAQTSATMYSSGEETGVASSVDAGVALLATDVQMLLASGRSLRLEDTIVTLDPLTLDVGHNAVVRLPQCPVCGDPEVGRLGQTKRFELRPQPKEWTDDGGHRVNDPGATWRRLQHHISPLTGAVTSVRSQYVEENGIVYCYHGGHNFALMRDDTFFLRRNMRGRSGGKGRTALGAKVGALCEAIERFSAVYRGDEGGLQASYNEVSDRAVWIEDLLLFSDKQYAERDAFNAENPTSYHLVPGRLDPDRTIDWTSAWSLTHDAERLVPSGYCWYGHPDIARDFFTGADGNGCAAGNTPEEATLQALMELVERDAVGIWWYNRVNRPALEIDAFDEPYVRQVRDYYEGIERDLWFLDLTTDLGIPVVAAVSQRLTGPTRDLLMGFGAHIDPKTAAMRALTELNQFLPGVTERNPDGSTRYWMEDPDAIHWWKTATLETDPHLLPGRQTPTNPADFEQIASDDISEDVRRCVERLAAADLEVIVLDQSRPEIELSVVKVMVPHIRHFWRRLAPGRLNDVPVKLGWLEQPIDEDDLNPSSIFF